jgi:hypothetical protein
MRRIDHIDHPARRRTFFKQAGPVAQQRAF